IYLFFIIFFFFFQAEDGIRDRNVTGVQTCALPISGKNFSSDLVTPGAGPVGDTRSLEKFLPVPIVEFDGKNYYYNYNVPDSIGKIRSFHGNIGILARAYAYILNLGADGLKMVAETAVLNTNYVLSKVLA